MGSAQEDAALMLDGTAAQMVCTALPLLLTAHLLPRRQPLQWLPTSNVMVLSAQEDAAHMLDGTAALMVCTVLLLLLTAHLLPRRQPLPRWLPISSVMELSAQEDAAHMLDGTAAQMACTVLPLLLIVPMPKITSRNLLQECGIIKFFINIV